jgi:hypothetical protein
MTSLFLSKDDFMKLFQSNTTKAYKVRVGKRLIPLVEYARLKSIPAENINTLLDNVKHRNEYLERFYDVSMKPPETLTIGEPPMKNKHLNNNALVKYKNVIRNLFYKEILQDTKSGLANNPTFFDVLEDLYLNHIIDYKILTPSAMHYMNAGRLGSVFSSFYFRASIMNPYLVYSLNKSVLKGIRVFTPTLGWGSYLYGFLESGTVTEYVGTDVIPSVCRRTKQFAQKNYPDKSVTIYKSPSENLLKSAEFVSKYAGHFDVVFFSPPYWQLEMYPGANQSTTTYKTYESWLAGYWEQTIQLCQTVLCKGGKLCYILSGYGDIDLLDDMNRITRKYFTYVGTQPMYNKNVNSTNHRETSEQIMLWSRE